MKDKNPIVSAAVIFSIAFLIVGFIMSSTWKQHIRSNQTITVTGSAKKDIISDLGILKGSLNSRATTAQEAYRQLVNQKPALIAYLSKYGFTQDKINFQTVISTPLYEMVNGYNTNNIIGYSYSQRIEIQSNDVQKIKNISLDISSLIENGINFEVEQPEYYYTNLAQVKIEIQAEAAKDAMTRAKKIAESTDSKIGTLRNARMGVLQITPKNSNQVSDYGINDVSSIEKEITSVVNASFEIK
jgi:hypothetical protein